MVDANRLRVTAAVIEVDGRVLIAQRPEGDRLAGKWEFPGGKVEAGETPQACLARELREELDVEVDVGEHIGDFPHDYDHLSLTLLVYRVALRSGEPHAHDHSQIKWVRCAQLLDYNLADADIPIARVVAGMS